MTNRDPRDPTPIPAPRRRKCATSGPDADARAAGRERWRRWARLRREGKAVARVEYDGVGVAKLVLAGWLTRKPDDHGYPPEEVEAAIAEMIAKADLPKKKN
jgi:hypothetical protein